MVKDHSLLFLPSDNTAMNPSSATALDRVCAKLSFDFEMLNAQIWVQSPSRDWMVSGHPFVFGASSM